jgi:lipopolysaccharide/colanic/teichoic acid biosynthesis glycosyltransferase
MIFFNTSLIFVATDFWANVQIGRVRLYPVFKRVAATIAALVLLILLAPLFLALTLAIRLDSPGPALFRQMRIGKNGKPFTFYKFRSMYQDIDRSAHEAFLKEFVKGNVQEGAEDPNFFKPAQTNQITRVGRLLRKTSLDELPQLLNIIKGDMSFIGPRPNVPAEVDAYSEWHKRRLGTLPGVTGWAQIHGRSSIPFDQIVRYDIEYVENESFVLDLKILLSTVPTVLRGHGAR